MKKLSLLLLTALLTGCASGPTFLADSPKKDTSHYKFKKKPVTLTAFFTGTNR